MCVVCVCVSSEGKNKCDIESVVGNKYGVSPIKTKHTINNNNFPKK
jgi:hypothetical protein